MSDFGKKIQQHCQFWVSFFLKNLFQEEFFLLKKNKQFANCLKIPWEFFKSGEKLRTTDKKVSAWLKKFYSMPPLGFATENCLFLGKWLSSKTFSKLGWMFFGVWQKNFNRLSKLYLYLSREASSGEIFTKKNKQLDKFSDIERSFFGKFGRKNWFLAKSFQHSCHKSILHFQRDILGEKCFPKKIIWRNCICTLSGVLVSFYRICLACLSKTFHRLQMKVLRKISFSNKKLFTQFLQNVERCRTLTMNLLPIVENAFHLSTGTFREKFVFGRNINSSIAFFRNRGDFFFRDLGRKQALGRKASARLPKLESTLAKCFIKKTYFFWRDKCLGTFIQIVGGFFSDSCEKHQKIVKLIFYLSRATSPCDNFLLGNYRVW